MAENQSPTDYTPHPNKSPWQKDIDEMKQKRQQEKRAEAERRQQSQEKEQRNYAKNREVDPNFTQRHNYTYNSRPSFDKDDKLIRKEDHEFKRNDPVTGHKFKETHKIRRSEHVPFLDRFR